MTLGFTQTGRFESVFANDFDRDALDSYQLNFDPEHSHSIARDIHDLIGVKPGQIPKGDVVIGGPPCQGFSLLNKQRLGDPRRQLWYQFILAVKESNAKVVVMENVRQLLTSPEYQQIKSAFHELGFDHIEARVLLAANYGVPEMRFRTIIMASRTGVVSLPRPTHFNPATIPHLQKEQDLFGTRNYAPWKTVRDAIGDLPKPEGTEIRDEPPPFDLHFGRNPSSVSRERYRAIPPGGNRFDLLRNRPDITPACWVRKTTGGTDLMGRLRWDQPSVTIRTEFFKPEKGRYLHPDQHRPITHREAARIQTFPDNFQFSGGKTQIAKQIGNAVPPLLARAIAEEVLACLEQRRTPAYVRETNEKNEYLRTVGK